jgi:hypothetical protein
MAETGWTMDTLLVMSDQHDNLAPGQALEFEIWSELIKQSQGALHVFLPLLDRGLDAVLHRFTDGRYIPIQVKGRSQVHHDMVQIVVKADSLVDDDALLIGAFSTDTENQLDLIVDERNFKRLATHSVSNGHEIYEAAFSMHPGRSRWRPYLIPRTQLAEHMLSMAPSEALQGLDRDLLRPSERHHSWLGFLGEAEVVRRLAENSRLDLFRPFPDLEMVEVLVRDNVTRNFAGLQVKTATVAHPTGEAQFHIRKSTLSRAANAWVVCLAWWQDARAFDPECLLVSATDVPQIGTDTALGFEIFFNPKNPRRTRLDPYRHQLANLADLILEACAQVDPLASSRTDRPL